MVYIFCCNILTIVIDIIQSCICVISNLIFSFNIYIFLPKDLLRNENNPFLMTFFCGFSNEFTTLILETSILSNENKI
jgi:hypothetical protein